MPALARRRVGYETFSWAPLFHAALKPGLRLRPPAYSSSRLPFQLGPPIGHADFWASVSGIAPRCGRRTWLRYGIAVLAATPQVGTHGVPTIYYGLFGRFTVRVAPRYIGGTDHRLSWSVIPRGRRGLVDRRQKPIASCDKCRLPREPASRAGCVVGKPVLKGRLARGSPDRTGSSKN